MIFPQVLHWTYRMFHQNNKLNALQAKYSNSPQAPKRNLVIRYQSLVILFHLLRWCSNFHCWYFYFCYWSIIFTIWYRQAVLNLRLVILTIIQIIWYLAVTMSDIILLDYYIYIVYTNLFNVRVIMLIVNCWASRVLSKFLVRYFFFSLPDNHIYSNMKYFDERSVFLSSPHFLHNGGGIIKLFTFNVKSCSSRN